MSDKTVACIECDDEVAEADAVYGRGTADLDAIDAAKESGDTVPPKELFTFDGGPYCGFECLIRGGPDE